MQRSTSGWLKIGKDGNSWITLITLLPAYFLLTIIIVSPPPPKEKVWGDTFLGKFMGGLFYIRGLIIRLWQRGCRNSQMHFPVISRLNLKIFTWRWSSDQATELIVKRSCHIQFLLMLTLTWGIDIYYLKS